MSTTERFPTDLSDADAILWRIEEDPVLRSPVVAVALLDRSPRWTSVVGAFERAAEVLPRLRQRIVPGPFGRLRWEEVDHFALDHHVRRICSGEGGGVEAALEVAGRDATTAFDPARPPWQAVIVEGLHGDAAALILRFHHAITDGVGGIDLAEAIFDRSRRPSRAEEPAVSDAEAPPRPHRSIARSGATTLAALGLGSLRAARHPLDAARAAQRQLGSVVRIVTPVPGAMSPLLAERGLDRRLLVAESPLMQFEASARAAGGTVNDVFLAVVAGALRRYHDELGSPIGELRVTMPISLRRPGDPPGGNHFAPARFVLPIDDDELAHRTRMAGTIVRRWRAEPSLGVTDVLTSVLNRLPRSTVTRVFGGLLRSIDVDAVDVPGLRHPTYLAGARVERLWAFSPPTGAALSVTLVSHEDMACIGVNCDLAAVSAPGVLARCLDEALRELDAAEPLAEGAAR
jgi:WS/DGAT/MGAT family acyltransferase